jgi:hypothetical protein
LAGAALLPPKHDDWAKSHSRSGFGRGASQVIQIMMLSQESKMSEWPSKKRQIQGAELSRNEAYPGTPQ